MSKRPSKKTETIEIRLSPELKSALSDLSLGRGRSMSETVRAMIEGEVAGGPKHQPIGDLPMTIPNPFLPRAMRGAAFLVPVLTLALIYLMTAQSPATASEEARVFFAELDQDADAQISLPEITSFLTEDGWEPDPVCASDTVPGDEPCTLAAMAQAQLDRVDSDGDGVVSFAELSAVLIRDRAADFLEMDIDENGMLSIDEMAAMELYWYAEEPEIAAEEGVVLSSACQAQLLAEDLPGIAAICQVEGLARIEVAIYDTDRDGRVSLTEYLSH
ncbi:MAG: hypothetical protein AAGA70_08790 [Pseudomonadota bacterium]